MPDNDPTIINEETRSNSISDLPRRTVLIVLTGFMGGLAGCNNTESADESNEDTETNGQEEGNDSANENETGTSGENASDSEGGNDSVNENETGTSGENTSEEETNDHDAETSNAEASSMTTLVINYDGDWSGTLEIDNSSRSISGSSPRTIEIENENDSIAISATITKDDDSTNTLSVELIVNDQVVQSSSTNSPSGTVTLSYQRH